MITDLVQIRRLGESKREENSKLRMHLKRRNFQERKLMRISQEIEEQIDCTACANCCRVATVKITERDALKLSKTLGVSLKQFWADYAEESPEEGAVLKRNENAAYSSKGIYAASTMRGHTLARRFLT
jgi:hypothetical protein